MKAAKNEDISLVSCTDSKGRDFQVLCVLAPAGPEGGDVYIPFGMMITPTLYPLINKLQPPDALKGDWMWEE
jgi:hypothetical protein